MIAPIALSLDRTLPGTPETVFRALTQPDLYARWIGPEGSETFVEEMDPSVGGRFLFRVRMGEGMEFAVTGTYREVDPPRRLVHTWGMADDPADVSTVAFELTADGDGTRIVVTHTGLVDEDDRAQNDAGWRTCLDRLEALLTV